MPIALSLTLCPAYAKEAILDPMRPPGKSVLTISSEPARKWNLTAILVSPERRLAMINNRLMEVGEKIDGAKVKVINSNTVELEVEGRRLTLRPGTYPVRKPKL
jgi:hypothetical protein